MSASAWLHLSSGYVYTLRSNQHKNGINFVPFLLQAVMYVKHYLKKKMKFLKLKEIKKNKKNGQNIKSFYKKNKDK